MNLSEDDLVQFLQKSDQWSRSLKKPKKYDGSKVISINGNLSCWWR